MEYCRGDFKTVRAIQVDMKNYTIFKHIFRRKKKHLSEETV